MKLSEGAWKCLEQLDELLEASAVVLVAPGDVDLLAYVYKSFAPQFSSKLLQRVSEGSLILGPKARNSRKNDEKS